jgi:hypothetical protein
MNFMVDLISWKVKEMKSFRVKKWAKSYRMVGKYRPGDEEICTPAPLAVVDCALTNRHWETDGVPPVIHL